MTVSRCVCYDISLEALKHIAKETSATFEQLQEKTGCSTGCGMCEPYVRLMLRTGQTAFQPLPPHEAERLVREKGDTNRS